MKFFKIDFRQLRENFHAKFSSAILQKLQLHGKFIAHQKYSNLQEFNIFQNSLI